jgi:hypothetical protein
MEFSALTRSKYEAMDEAATLGLISVSFFPFVDCALNEDAASNSNSTTATQIAKRVAPASQQGPASGVAKDSTSKSVGELSL